MSIENQSEMRTIVLEALDEIRPYLQSDGGDIELVSIDEEALVVSVKLLGNCATCAINGTTMKLGVENTIRKYLPHIKEVVKIN